MNFKEFRKIVRRNFLSPVIIAVYSLSIILLILSQYRDAYFISFVITINFVVAVIQEVRARIKLHKLELMSAPMAHRVGEDGHVVDVMYTDLHVGDVIVINSGDEVPADGQITSVKGLEVDESMLTGESTSVEKTIHESVYASSNVVAGSAKVEVTGVGDDTHAGEMTKALKQYTPEHTPLQKKINFVISILCFGAVFLAILVGVVYSLMGENLISIFKTITSGAITVVPEGLLLASTLLLAFGSIKLATANVLPQKISAIEAMALMNVLCVDKTGTLTDPKVIYDDFVAYDDTLDSRYTKELIGLAAQETSGNNSTGEALMAGFPIPDDYDIKDILSFSSDRKMAGLRAKFSGHETSVFIGAPEFVSKITKNSDGLLKESQKHSLEGKRVLMVASYEKNNFDLKELSEKKVCKPIGLVLLRNDLRDNVEETVKFLQQRGVSIRVISGDNPDTVRYIATKAGIFDTEKIITGDELASMNDRDFFKSVYRSTIFARVLPDQKERIVKTLQNQNKFVGMVGDGINDALALKQSNLGVAMYSGAAATRRVADIVLLNNSFSSLPIGMKLGNRIMQAIEIIATLFFHKIIYGVLLLCITMFIGIVYPFQPRHVTFMNTFMVTLPTIMWTLFPPKPSYRVNPQDFWKDTLIAVAPIAILSGLAVTFTYWYLTKIGIDDNMSIATTTVIVATAFGVYLVFLVPQLLRVKYDLSAKLARTLYVLAAIFVAYVAFGFGLTRDFFDFTRPAFSYFYPVAFVILGVAWLQWTIANKAGRRIQKRENTEETLVTKYRPRS